MSLFPSIAFMMRLSAEVPAKSSILAGMDGREGALSLNSRNQRLNCPGVLNE
jgi:hypothetical protein